MLSAGIENKAKLTRWAEKHALKRFINIKKENNYQSNLEESMTKKINLKEMKS